MQEQSCHFHNFQTEINKLIVGTEWTTAMPQKMILVTE
jgi:hypothetical protein